MDVDALGHRSLDTMRLRIAARMLILVALAACHPNGDKDGRPGNPSKEAVVPTITPAAEVPTVLHVSWSTQASGSSWVEYGLEALDQQTPTTGTGTDHAVAVLGLKAGRTYSLRAVTEMDGERIESEVQTVDIAQIPDWYGHFEISQYDPSRAEMTDGYLLVGISTAVGGEFSGVGSAVGIIDADGDYVWFVDMPPAVGNLSPSVTSTGILWDEYDSYVADDKGTAGQLDITGHGPIVRTRLEEGHHVVIETEPGTLAFVARDIQTVQVNEEDVVIQTDRLRDISVGSEAPPREIFGLFDQLKDDYHWPCVHTVTPWERTDYPEVFEWTHGNSLIYEDGALFFYTRWTDTLYKVDPISGELLWQIGGPNSDFTRPNGDPAWTDVDDSVWSHAHLSQVWDGGLMMFDNGNHHVPNISSIVEYRFDEELQTIEEVFRFNDPLSRVMGAVGDARKLPGGNYMGSWTTWGQLTEVAPDGEVVWRATHAKDYMVVRVRYIPDLYALAAAQE